MSYLGNEGKIDLEEEYDNMSKDVEVDNISFSHFTKQEKPRICNLVNRK